ncbi:unnamed protein product [Fasciola hepatica]|uniref:Uncharacterized protein n=1 Tax=Fasciola hepatica TaxID=6192 RepID=A0ABC9HI83_FASHE
MLIILFTLGIISFTIVTVDGTGTTTISGEVDILRSSICQVVTLSIRGMSRTMSNECKQREVAELNAAFHKYLAFSNVARFSFMNVTGVSIKRNISQYYHFFTTLVHVVFYNL